MIFTLLTFLRHYYPTVNVKQHFTEEAIDRNQNLYFDEEKQMVIDKDSQHDHTEDPELLLGFEIDVLSDPNNTNQEALCPSETEINDGMPQDDDSISTLGGAPSMFNVPSPRNLAKAAFPPTPSSASVTSVTSGVTMESLNSLQFQLESLQTRLDRQEQDTQSKFDQLIQLMSRNPPQGRANHSCDGHNSADNGDAVGAGL